MDIILVKMKSEAKDGQQLKQVLGLWGEKDLGVKKT